MEAQTTVSNSTQCSLFIGEYKKYMVSGVTSSKPDTWCPNQLVMLLEALVVCCFLCDIVLLHLGVDKYT